MKFPNHVREERNRKGMTREELARLVGVTRQSIGLIESGRVCPSTVIALRISHELGCSVEELFWDQEKTMEAHFVGNDFDRVRGPVRAHLSSIRGNIIARPVSIETLGSIHSLAHGISQNIQMNEPVAEFRLLQSPDSIFKTVFVSGCDIGLGLLANYTGRASSHSQAIWFNVSNRQALEELENGMTHIAAVHYPTNALKINTGKMLSSCRQFHFASSELGWILPRNNPRGFQGAEDLKTCRLRLINREEGSGAKALLDHELRRMGLHSEEIPGYLSPVRGHFAIADAIAKGFADVGIGHSAAAILYGLTFLPIQQETCTLLIPEEYVHHEAVQVLLDTLNYDSFRMELSSFGPYDVKRTGNEIQ